MSAIPDTANTTPYETNLQKKKANDENSDHHENCPANKKTLERAIKGLDEAHYGVTYLKLFFNWLTIALTIMTFWARSSWLLLFQQIRLSLGNPSWSEWTPEDFQTFRKCFEDSILVSKVCTIALGFVVPKISRRWSAIMVQVAFLIGISGFYIGSFTENFYWPIFITSSIWGSFLTESLNCTLWIMRYFCMTKRRLIPPLLNSGADASLMVPELYRYAVQRGWISAGHSLIPMFSTALVIIVGIYFSFPGQKCRKVNCHCEEIQKTQDLKEGLSSFQNITCVCDHPCGKDPCATVVFVTLDRYGSEVEDTIDSYERMAHEESYRIAHEMSDSDDCCHYESQAPVADTHADAQFFTSFGSQKSFGRDAPGTLKLKNFNFDSDPVMAKYEHLPFLKMIQTRVFIVAVIAFASAFTTKLNIINFENARFSLVPGSDEEYVSHWTRTYAVVVSTVGIPMGLILSVACAFIPVFWMYFGLHLSFILSVGSALIAIGYEAGHSTGNALMLTSVIGYVMGKGFIMSGFYVIMTTYFGIDDISRLVSTAYVAVLFWTKFTGKYFAPTGGKIETIEDYRNFFMLFIYVHLSILILLFWMALKEGWDVNISAKTVKKSSNTSEEPITSH
eukprot:GHVH01007562.1.p1 GENE.GHVH01007562.1~~GHVH01007562.1.p1  ORF type:complete len:620 (+),score=52.50 GHVH01007562.1:189-2048(+)